MFLYTLFFLYRAGVSLFYPFGLQYGEGAVFYECGQLLKSGFNPASLYTPNLNPPYQAAIYSPLFYYLHAGLMWLFSGPTSLVGGRLLSLGASAYIAWSLYRITARQELAPGRPARVAIRLAAAATPFATTAIYTTAPIAKSDMVVIALSLAAVQIIWRTEERTRQNRNQYRPYVLAGLLCALALLTKQSALAAPAAIVIWLGLGRRWPQLGAFLGTLLATGGAVFLFFQVATGGYFFNHVVTYNAQPYDLTFLGAGLGYLLRDHFVLVVLAACWLAQPFVGRYVRMDIWRIYLLTAFAVSFTAGKVGSAFNYYMETLCLLSLLAWCQAGQWYTNRTEARVLPIRFRYSTLAFSLLAVQLILLHHIPLLADSTYTPGPTTSEQARQVAEQVLTLSRQGPMLTEDSGWQAELNIPTELDDIFVFTQLEKDGHWDSSLFIERLNTGYYKNILFEISSEDTGEEFLAKLVQENKAGPFERRFSDKMLEIMGTRYAPDQRIGRWLFLTWKG